MINLYKVTATMNTTVLVYAESNFDAFSVGERFVTDEDFGLTEAYCEDADLVVRSNQLDEGELGEVPYSNVSLKLTAAEFLHGREKDPRQTELPFPT